jgi:RHH-type proline utilization regulon transcriptional repressor/proline dehydrogenase/delta 1-pyrroline-5-carboxylate dehydrogenase
MKDAREKRIRDIGSELFASREDAPVIFNSRRWQGKIIEWVMKDESFKVQFLRFIDVLPGLRTDNLVLQLFKEYFGQAADAPPIIRYGIERLYRGNVIPRVSASIIRQAVTSLARQFIAGSNPHDALKSLESFRTDCAGLSVDLLGEAVVSDVEARRYRERYLDLLKFLAPEATKDQGHHQTWEAALDISLKVSSFYSQMEPLDWEGSIEKTKSALLPVFRLAQSLGASITFDMEHYYYKDLTLDLFKDILGEFREFRSAGIALQAYLKDTREDLLSLLDWAKTNDRRITIRLVKGAYWDHETIVNRQKGWPLPVFPEKAETDRNFEDLTEVLFEHAAIAYPAIATHNIRSISNAIALAEEFNLSKQDFEFQTLFGMGEPVRRSLTLSNMPVRVYCPVGELIPGMAYLVRRILENTSPDSFLRKSFADKRPVDELLIPPQSERPMTATFVEGFRNEPATDFSKAANRQAMKHALADLRKRLGKRYPLYVGDAELFTERNSSSLNPAEPHEVIGIISSASMEHAERAIHEAKGAHAVWKHTPSEKRVEVLFRAAEEMRKRRFDLAALEVYEVGKTIMEADADIAEAIDYLEYYGRQMLALAKPRYLGSYPGEVNEYRYEPRGVAVVISPWNFPLAIPAGMASAAIVTGNCAILKPSGLSPVTAWQLVDILRTAGLPPGVLQYLPGSGSEIGEFLVAHPGTDLIAFTGSKDVGLKIIKIAGDTRPGQAMVKKVIAEMGGKNAIIVDDTADLDEAVKGVLESSLSYQGQKCSACSRVIIFASVFTEFCDRLKEAMKSVAIGPPEEVSTFMGPLVDSAAFNKVRQFIERGEKEGSAMLIRETGHGGFYVGPAVFEVKPEASLAREEIFGPVLSVIRARDIDDAIAIANNTDFALTGGIFSRSPANIQRVGDQFKAGNLYINRKITGALVGRQPFGGLGMSGIGSKAGGPDYLLQFMNPKSISENTLRKGFAPIR